MSLARGLFVALLVAACTPAGDDSRRNVLWLTIDTLRADRLGCYGHERETSPNIDALAARGVRFESAYATAPWTAPSVASMLTGLLPRAHGVERPNRLFPAEAEHLPGRFVAAGYRTAAVVSNKNLARGTGLEHWFGHFDDAEAQGVRHVSSPGVADRTEALLAGFAETGEPFFLFALFCDPHHLYQDQPGIEFAGEPGPNATGDEGIRELHSMLDRMGEEDRTFLLGLYDEEVRFTDAAIGRVLEALERLGLSDSTLVILTSDHGEEILDRGWIGHTVTLHEELVRVPLVMAGPELPAGRVVDGTVSLAEVGPAVLEWVLADENGRAELPLLAVEAAAVFEVDFFQDNLPEKTVRMEGLRRGEHKLIRDRESGRVRLFDLALDPRELSDVAEQRPELRDALLEALDGELRAAEADALPVSERTLDPRTRRMLDALGYGGGTDGD